LTLRTDGVGDAVSIVLCDSQIEPKVVILLMRVCRTESWMGAGLLEAFQLANLCGDRFRGVSRSPLGCLCSARWEARSEMRLRGHRKFHDEQSHRLCYLLSSTLEALRWLWTWTWSRSTHVYMHIVRRSHAGAAVAMNWLHRPLMSVFDRRLSSLIVVLQKHHP
jgi:hypothetical protein